MLEEGLLHLEVMARYTPDRKIALFCINEVIYNREDPDKTGCDVSELARWGLLISIDQIQTNLNNFKKYPNKKSLSCALSLLKKLILPPLLHQAYVYSMCYADSLDDMPVTVIQQTQKKHAFYDDNGVSIKTCKRSK